MQDIYNFDLNVEQNGDYSLQVQADTSEQYAMRLNEAVNVVIQQGGKIYCDTTAAWNLQHQLVTEFGAIYVYSDKETIYDDVGNPIIVPGIKVGDGTSYLIDMPFVGDEILYVLAEHMSDSTRHITEAERIFWNNKVSGYLDEHNNETLVLSKTQFRED